MQLGRYEVIRKLGEGGMARVMLGKSAAGNLVVLKVPFTQNPDFAERVRDEARVGLRLNHPGVVDTLDLFEHDGRPILVVEYVEGASLQQLRKHAGPMPPGMVARLGRQVAEALAFLHDARDENDKPLNMLHRDVTPGNILVTREGNGKLIDLGIARSLETKAKKTAIGTVRGTMRYLAPELLAGDPHSPATDLWALGVVLLEASLGRRACAGDEREILAAIIDGRLTTLQPGEEIPAPLSDGVFALLAEKSARLQRAMAAGAVLKRIEDQLPPELGWAKGAIQRVLDIQAAKESEAAEAALAEADTHVGPPPSDDPRPVTMDQPTLPPDDRTAATVASVRSAPAITDEPVKEPTATAAELGAPTRMMEEVQLPEDAYPDGVAKDLTGISTDMPLDDNEAPTIRMEAVDIPSEAVSDEQVLPPGAATEIMPAVDYSDLPENPIAPGGPALPNLGNIDQTMKFPRPGTPQNPAGPAPALAWQSVAAPGVLGGLGKPAAPAAPAAAPATPPAPSLLTEEPERPAPEDPTEPGSFPPAAPSTPLPPAAGRPLPRVLQAGLGPAQTDNEIAALDPRNLPPALVTAERTQLEGDVISQEPTVTAIGEPGDHTVPSVPEPTNPVASATEPTQPGVGESANGPAGTELAMPQVVVPTGEASAGVEVDAVTPIPQPAATGLVGSTPDADTAPVDEKSAQVAQHAARAKAGAPVGDSDETERVKRWSAEDKAEIEKAAAGFEDPLMSGELEWQPKRGKWVAIGVAAVVGIGVIVGVLFATGVL